MSFCIIDCKSWASLNFRDWSHPYCEFSPFFIDGRIAVKSCHFQSSSWPTKYLLSVYLISYIKHIPVHPLRSAGQSILTQTNFFPLFPLLHFCFGTNYLFMYHSSSWLSSDFQGTFKDSFVSIIVLKQLLSVYIYLFMFIDFLFFFCCPS